MSFVFRYTQTHVHNTMNVIALKEQRKNKRDRTIFVLLTLLFAFISFFSCFGALAYFILLFFSSFLFLFYCYVLFSFGGYSLSSLFCLSFCSVQLHFFFRNAGFVYAGNHYLWTFWQHQFSSTTEFRWQVISNCFLSKFVKWLGTCNCG